MIGGEKTQVYLFISVDSLLESKGFCEVWTLGLAMISSLAWKQQHMNFITPRELKKHFT